MKCSPHAWALCAVDPGGTTGIATALIDTRQPTVAAAMKRASRKGLLQTHTITGPYTDQVIYIMRMTNEFWFRNHVELGRVGAGHCSLAVENFVPRNMGVDLTSLQIISGIECFMAASGQEDSGDQYSIYIKQMPSEGIGFCSDDMLKDWGLYRGKTTHERDALRHLAKRVDKLLGAG